MRLEDIQKAFLRGISKRNVESTKLLIDLLWAADPDIVATLGLSEIIIQRISELSDNHLIVIKALLEKQQPHPIEKAQAQKQFILKLKQAGSSPLIIESALAKYGKLVSPEALLECIDSFLAEKGNR